MGISEKIAVIGLGYVGLPLAMALARAYPDTIGFDISQSRIEALRHGHDWSGEQNETDIKKANLTYAYESTALEDCTFFIVTVPTPITDDKKPDLSPLQAACKTVGAALKNYTGTIKPIVVFESTVYPGLTEEICGPALEHSSGKKRGTDFTLGYSPERINPGDPVHKLETITKVIAAEDAMSLQRLEAVYGAVIKAGLHKAPSIAVAEAAKVLENTQRDLNVALMNELALICERMNIRTKDVLDAAGTKWNFLKFTPGLVGGHCIGVDPYYLTTRAISLGYHPEVILAGRRINDSMGGFIADKITRWLNDKKINQARIGILGLTFKENVRDLRNSRVPDIFEALKKSGFDVLVHDPMVDAHMAQEEYGITPVALNALNDLDVLVLAVPHDAMMQNITHYLSQLKQGGLCVDIKSVLNPADITPRFSYWSL